MNKILCIGEALIDMICTNTGKTLSDGENFLKKAGGAPTNVAAAIAALGGKVDLIAKIGIDPFGKHLIEVMQNFGVDTKYMFQDETHFTTFAFVSLMENGERDFYFNRGADAQLNWNEIKHIDLDEYNIIHFGSATAFLNGSLQDAYFKLLEKAIEKNIYISFDPNYRHLLFKDNKDFFIAQSWKFIDQCNFFKVSDEEALMLTNTENVKDACTVFQQKSKANFAITIGKDGTIFGNQNNVTTIPSIAINSIDTTGAGDAFVGALLFQLANCTINNLIEIQWQKLISNANIAGAKTCEHYGAMEALKHLNKEIFN
jgi:fructokinase